MTSTHRSSFSGVQFLISFSTFFFLWSCELLLFLFFVVRSFCPVLFSFFLDLHGCSHSLFFPTACLPRLRFLRLSRVLDRTAGSKTCHANKNWSQHQMRSVSHYGTISNINNFHILHTVQSDSVVSIQKSFYY